MINTPDKYTERLLEAAIKKLGLLQNMMKLTITQSQSIDEDGVGTLEKIVDEKQQIIDEINRLDEQFNVYFLRLKSALKIRSLDDLKNHQISGIKELQEVIGQIMELTNRIFELEKKNSEKAKNLLHTFECEIKKVNQGKKISSAYNPMPPQASSYYIDKKK